MNKLVFTAFAVGLGLTASVIAQVPSYVPTNGLVGWWPFNGNANDESGNGNNGTVNGAILTADRFGNVGKAYSFDGVDDFINCSFSGPAGANIDISVTFWMKTSQSSYGEIIGYGNDQITGQDFRIYINGQQGCNNAMYFDSYSSAKGINTSFLNVWDFYTLKFKGTGLNSVDSSYFYKNGVLQSSGCFYSTISLMNISNLFPLTFGKYHGNLIPGSFFNGDLDDIGIWNRALTDQEISDLYNANICYEYVTVTDTLVINTGITGYNPITYLNTLKIWPNPSNDHITIDAGNLATMNGYSIKIEDAQGQQVFQNAVNQQQFYVDITTWGGNGLYFVRIIDPQGNTVDIKKIVLQ